MANRFATLNARFPHKRAFITGAGSGLGLELARALAQDGWTLGLFDRNLERLTVVEAQFANAGVPVLAYPGDVTQADELTVAVNSFSAAHNGLDMMINNFCSGYVDLGQRSLAENLYWSICRKIVRFFDQMDFVPEELQRRGNRVE